MPCCCGKFVRRLVLVSLGRESAVLIIDEWTERSVVKDRATSSPSLTRKKWDDLI
jgi:hypothetical protein